MTPKLIIGIDARDGMVSVQGWTEDTKTSAVDFAKELDSTKVAAIIFTDISRDGMLQGPNLESIKEFAEAAQLPVIASGGVSRLEDIENLKKLESSGVEGVIIGKALYDKTLSFADAKKIV